MEHEEEEADADAEKGSGKEGGDRTGRTTRLRRIGRGTERRGAERRFADSYFSFLLMCVGFFSLD
jgi:hypothetical protein